MSPTYRTASRMKEAARANGWEIVPASDPQMRNGGATGYNVAWGFHRDGITISVKENRRGGLTFVHIGRPFCDGYDGVTLDHNYSGKLDKVLDWLAGGMDWTEYGFRANV